MTKKEIRQIYTELCEEMTSKEFLEAAGLKIIGIEAINEGGTYSFDSGLNNFRSKGMADEAAVAETVVQAAKIQVNSTVNITFKAE